MAVLYGTPFRVFVIVICERFAPTPDAGRSFQHCADRIPLWAKEVPLPSFQSLSEKPVRCLTFLNVACAPIAFRAAGLFEQVLR
ncbi:MAG: hypothetical protein ACUVWS_14395, partial [Roseiflexus sp.]